MEGNIVTVQRDGKPVNIPEDALRKGDLLLLQAGDLVAADLKLVEARGLEIDEWELTGEIVPVAKRVDEHAEVSVYRGSNVTRGSGSGVVTATGEETEYAQCVKQSWERMRYRRPRLFTRGSLVVLVFLAPPFVLAAVRHENGVVLGLLAAALAVLAVVLENSALFDYVATRKELSRIEQQGIRIRDVGALEVMERINVVCLDKTGVLTTRELRVREIYLAGGPCELAYFAASDEAATLVRTGCALCNDFMYAEKAHMAAPIDRALIAFGRTSGTDIADAQRVYRRIYDKPFDSEERYMACGFESGEKTVFFAKGDPDVVLKMCGTYSTLSGTQQKLDLPFWTSTRTHAESISKAGDVLMALAYGVGESATPPLHYTFLCLIQLENPLVPSVPGVLRELRGAGIRTVMLTGDRTETALKIAGAATG